VSTPQIAWDTHCYFVGTRSAVELDALVPVRWVVAFVALHGAFALIALCYGNLKSPG